MNLQRIISSEIAWRLGWTIAHSLWQGTVAAIALAVVLRMMRRRSPQARYAAALGVLVLLLVSAGITWRLVSVPEQVSISTSDPVRQRAIADCHAGDFFASRDEFDASDRPAVRQAGDF